MRIAVIGAGAIGSAIAVALMEAGRDVLLVARGRRLAALRAGPLHIESNGCTRAISVPACAVDDLGRGTINLAICCVKTNGLEEALRDLRETLKPGAVVLTLQNGVEAHDVAARILPEAAIVACRMHGFFEMTDDVVRHVGVPPSILLGSTQGNVDAEQVVVEVLAGSGIAVDVCADITLALWEKFLLAASLGSVGAALATPAGQVLATPQGEVMLREAMAEVVALARYRGIALDDRNIAQALTFVASFPPDATTSLQRDLTAGRASEYDALTAAVGRLARESGMAIAVFPKLEALIPVRPDSRCEDLNLRPQGQ